MKVLYLTLCERRPGRANSTGQITGWKQILEAFAVTHGDCLGIDRPMSFVENLTNPVASR